MVVGIADIVKENTNTAGLGNLTLTGASALARSFNDAGLNGKEVPYRIVDPVTGDWEITIGTFTAPSTLSRAPVPFSSTNAGAKVDLAGNPETFVFVDVPSAWYYLPGNFTQGSVLFAGVGGIISEGNLAWDTTTDTLLVTGTSAPAVRIAEAGSTTHYAEFINWSTAQSQMRHVSSTGLAHFQIDSIAVDLAGNQIISFHDGALMSTGATLVEFHTRGTTSKNAVVGCDMASHTYFCADFGNFGVGFITTPDSKFHVMASSAGTVSAPTGTIGTFESSGPGYVSVLVPNNHMGGLIVGCPTDNDRGILRYDCSSTRWEMLSDGTQVLLARTSGVVIGAGITAPDGPLHVHESSAGSIAAHTDAVIIVESGSHSSLAFLSPNTMTAGITFGDPQDLDVGEIYYNHATNLLVSVANAVEISWLSGTGLGIGTAAAPTARVESSVGATDALPTLKLKQLDLSEQFIEYNSTSAASAANPISSWKSGGQIEGFVRQSINGSHFWMPYFSAPTSANRNFAEVAITAATTLTSAAFGKMHVISGTTANYTITLPAVSGNAGAIIYFRVAPYTSANRYYTLDGDGTELIDESLTRMMWATESAALYCDGTGWRKLWGRTVAMSCILRRETTHPISYNTWTHIPTIVRVEDNTQNMAVPFGNLTTGRAEVIRPGNYLSVGFASISGVAAGKEFNGGVSRNNAAPQDNPNSFGTVSVPASGTGQMSGTATFKCAAGDWIGTVAFHDDNAGTGVRNTRAVGTVYPCLSVSELNPW